MKINSFEFGGISSLDCGLYVEKRPPLTVPLRDLTKTHVPGRSGDVIQDNGIFLNVTRTYKVGCSDIDSNTNKIKKLISQTGYQILIDSYDSDAYYYGAIVNAVSFEEELLNVGHASIQFDCEPYRYIIKDLLGKVISVDSTKTTAIINPYEHIALPRIYIVANDNLGSSVTIKLNDSSFIFTFPAGYKYVSIDSSAEACYYGDSNLNAGYGSDAWPELQPGGNTICVIGAKSAKIFPNWRTI